MNNGSQGQPAQGQPGSSQPRPQPRPMTVFRPENMRSLPDQFSQAEKEQWEKGLRQLWTQVESNPAESPIHQTAKQKIADFSKNLTLKVQAYRVQQAAKQQLEAAAKQQIEAAQAAVGGAGAGAGAAAGTGAANANPNTQVQQNQPRPQPDQGQASQGQPAGAGVPNPAQQPRPPVNKSQVPERILHHINTFPWKFPPHLTQGTPEASKWLADSKSKYARGLMAMENSNRQVKMNDDWMKKIREERTPTEQEEKDFMTKDGEARKQHAAAKKFIDDFRDVQRRAQQPNSATSNTNGNPVGGNGAIGSGVGGNVPGGNAGNENHAVARPQMNAPQASNPALQNTQTVNAAIEQARNQQMGGRPPMAQTGQISQPPQMPPQNAPAQPNMPQSSAGPVQNVKAEAGVPAQINTAVAQIQNQQRTGQLNSPQSAVPQSANSLSGPSGQNPSMQPKALTHQAALQTAAQSYSSGQMSSTPTVMGHSHTHPNAPQRDMPTVNSQKLPIPKHLPERATQLPQPVQMNQSRPTFSGGPSGSGNGVLGQPVVAKPPGYVLDGEGDRVLSRKKLDELVKQVTGGGESISGGGLTAEVEESVLTVADNFVDQVLQAACKNAKERGSNILEIRDIQLTLERGYNIRIPGYASDEIRTVRKIAPSPGWINKMSAVQAAKVTGGKSSD